MAAASPFQEEHPSISILLPSRAESPQSAGESNELSKRLNNASSALLEKYTRDIICGIDCRTSQSETTRLLELISPNAHLRLGMIRELFPAQEYFNLYRLDSAKGVYRSMRVVDVLSDAQALRGTGRTFAVVEVISRKGVLMHGIQVFQWRFRSNSWYVSGIAAWRGYHGFDLHLPAREESRWIKLPDREVPQMAKNWIAKPDQF